MLISFCVNDFGREYIAELSPSGDYHKVNRSLALSDELLKFVNDGNSISGLIIEDIRPEIKRIAIDGSVIDAEWLIPFSDVITGTFQLWKTFGDSEKFPLISSLIHFNPQLKETEFKLRNLMNEEGEIRDDASENLLKIRQRIRQLQRDADKRIQQIWKQYKNDGIIDEDINIAIRNHRLVIPIPAASKRIFRGVVHDTSATGQTVFFEPLEVFDLNNEIQDCQGEERTEIRRILLQISDELRPLLPDIVLCLETLGKFDALYAKIKLARQTKAIRPFLSQNKDFVLKGARNPVLEASLKQSGKPIVPLNIRFSGEKKMLIISGPNAGGKSVAMKTAGMLQLMLQCGLLIPCEEGTIMSVFSKIMADIGDRQSIENDISTYSSHLAAMKFFLDHADMNTLVLVDEMGSGTEPEAGGAIAEEVLLSLQQKKASAVITTHFQNLKMLALQHPGFENAAMLFDNENIRPTYILRQGIPGNSFAVELAQRAGLPSAMLENAKNKRGKQRFEAEKLMQVVELEKKKLEDRAKQLEMAEEFVAELVQKYEKLNTRIQEKQNQIVEKSKAEAASILANANALIEKTIRDIKENAAEGEKVKQVRSEFTEKKSQLLQKKEQKPLKSPLRKLEGTEKLQADKIIVSGDFVKSRATGRSGEVVRVSGDSATVLMNEKMIQLPINDLEVCKGSISAQKKSGNTGVSLSSRKAQFSTSIDLRGKRVEEVVPELEKYIDEALLLGIRQVYILHGRGYGILRKVVRDYLRELGDLVSYRSEETDKGGDGITIVDFER